MTRRDSRVGALARSGAAAVAILASFGVAHAEPRPSSGFESAEANDLAAAAEAARAAGLFELCVEKDAASLELEKQPTTLVHLAGCADRADKVLLALRHMRELLERAIEQRDSAIADLARQRVERLLGALGTLTVSPPSAEDVHDLVVTVDDVALPSSRYGKPFIVDPGVHRVRATGREGTMAVFFDEALTIARGQRISVPVVLRPRPSEYLTPGQLACMQLGTTQDEVMRCFPPPDRPLVARAAIEASGYGDSLDVIVLNPTLRAHIGSPTRGWNVAANYQVDVISAASPDFVSTASPRGHDTRHALAVSGGYKPGAFGVDGAAAFSTESDYVARSAGIGLRADLFEKRMTPRFGWTTGYDTIGRGGTSFDVYSHELWSNEGSIGSAFVLGSRSVLSTAFTAAFERGDPSKPYRLIPMFARGRTLAPGASADLVNATRLPVRPYEQLPLERDRYAASARLVQRLAPTVTLRLEERLYADTWQTRASSTDVRFLFDVGSRFTLGPHGRFHVQSGASFFERIYHADVTTNTSGGVSKAISIPAFRTTDRELGPLYAYTLGGMLWWRLSSGDAPRFTAYASLDGLFTRYQDSLYVRSRIAGYGTIGLEVELE